VEGYVIQLHQNSPADSGYVISGLPDIDRAAYGRGKPSSSERNGTDYYVVAAE